MRPRENDELFFPSIITNIHAAAADGDLNAIKQIVSTNNAVINDLDEYGNTAINLSASRGHLRVVQYLQERGADINKENNRGFTPLCAAVLNGHFAVSEFLIRKGANVDTPNEKLWSPLHFAAQIGRLDIVQLLILHKANPIILTEESQTALHIGVRGGHHSVVDYLLKENVEKIDEPDIFDKTPLIEAAKNSDFKMCQLLLEYGAKIDRENEEGKTALFFVCDMVRLMELLIENCKCECHEPNRPQDCQGCCVNQVDQYGNTLLHIACKRGDVHIVRFLIDRVNNVNAFNEVGDRPLHESVRCPVDHNRLLMMNLLLTNGGANINAKNIGGYTSLHFAVTYDRRIRREEDIYEEDFDDSIPDTDIYICQFLLQRRAKVNSTTTEGTTALMLAAAHGDSVLVQLLLNYGADRNMKDNNGKTAFHYARNRKLELLQNRNEPAPLPM